MSTIPTVPTEIARITGLRNDIRSRLIQVGALSDADADLEACRDAMANVSTLTLDSIAITTPPDKVTYSPGETFDPTGMVVTAYFAYGDTTINFDVSDYTYPTEALELGTDEVTISYTFGTITKTATQEIGTLDIDEDLDKNSWETISWVARHGLGSDYWSIGDRKAITLTGALGSNLVLNNVTLYVYILDFNHPENGVPDNNIIFGGFFTEKTGGKDVCLVESAYGLTPDRNGAGRFAIANYYQETTTSTSGQTVVTGSGSSYGGWKGCDARYDLLGSVSSPPSGYGAPPTSSRTGYDATQTAIDSPRTKTIMSVLPSNFRSVLRLRAHFVDNNGYGQTYGGSDQYITECADAVSFLTECEVFGSCQYSSPYEYVKQTQMAYYANGGSKIKYKHSSTGTAANWWLASPRMTESSSYRNHFCAVMTDGSASSIDMPRSEGLAPVFKV